MSQEGLAEGHIHRWLGGELNMAVGQSSLLRAKIPRAVP